MYLWRQRAFHLPILGRLSPLRQLVCYLPISADHNLPISADHNLPISADHNLSIFLKHTQTLSSIIFCTCGISFYTSYESSLIRCKAMYAIPVGIPPTFSLTNYYKCILTSFIYYVLVCSCGINLINKSI